MAVRAHKVLVNLTVLIIAFLYSGIAIQVVNASENQVIKFTNGEWAPFTSEKLRYNGLFSKIVSEAFLQENITVEYDFYPWARGYKFLLKQSDGYSGSLGYVWSEKRAKELYFSDPIFTGYGCFFHLKSTKFDWQDYSDIEGLNIGTTIGYSYSPEFEEARKQGKLNITELSKQSQNFNMLLKGRIDIYPSNMDAGFNVLHNHFSAKDIEKITCHKKPYHQAKIYTVFPKNNAGSKKMVETFNRGLIKLQEKGLYDQFIKDSRAGKYLKLSPYYEGSKN